MSIIQLRRTARHPAPDQQLAGIDVERARLALQADRDAADLRRQQRRAAARRREKRVRRHARRAGLAKAALIAPILAVNAGAFYGQVSYVVGDVAPTSWPFAGQMALGLVLAGAAESIAVLVNWHAHDALLEEHTATAARLRRASYLIAGLFAGINYSHFAPQWDQPSAFAVIVGAFSLLSPVLWGIHTRRAHRIQLKEAGHQDCLGATFSAERFRSFPFRTIGARRWSIEHNEPDPRLAWAGYKADRRLQAQSQPAGRIGGAVAALRGRTPVAPGSSRTVASVASVAPVAQLPVASSRTRAVASESHAGESHGRTPVASTPSRTVAPESHGRTRVAPVESHQPAGQNGARDATLAAEADPDHVRRIVALVSTGDIKPHVPHREVMSALRIGAQPARRAQKAAQQALHPTNGHRTT